MIFTDNGFISRFFQDKFSVRRKGGSGEHRQGLETIPFPVLHRNHIRLRSLLCVPYVDGRDETAADRRRSAQRHAAWYHRRLPLLDLCRGQTRQRISGRRIERQKVYGHRSGAVGCRQPDYGSAWRNSGQRGHQQFGDIHSVRHNVGHQRLGAVHGFSAFHRHTFKVVPVEDTWHVLWIFQRLA